MAGEKNKDPEVQEEEVIVVTDDDLRERTENPPVESDDTDDEEDEDEEDSRLAKSEDDDDAPKKNERERRKRRKERQRQARERLERENRFYENWNTRLEKEVVDLRKKVSETQQFTIDGRIAQFESAIKKAENVHAEAISAGKGEEAAQALRIRDEFKEGLQRLRDFKAKETEAPKEEQEDTPPQIDPRILEKAKSWTSRNRWFDPARRDYSSRIAGAIDDSLQAEGYDPTTDEYWEELDDRIQEALPNVGKQQRKGRKKNVNGKGNGRDHDDIDEGDEDEPQRRKSAGGPAFRSGSQTRTLKKGEFYLSPERVEAMKEAGIWDDPEARAKMVKRYRDFDRENQE